jgi:four helix bundle protein
LTKDKFFSQPGDLLSQLRRAPLSISNNIAEGFERGTTAELLAFLYIARGSAGEVRSMLLFTERFREAAHLKLEISEIKSLAESCSRQIRAWADSLQNCDIPGQRHLNNNTRSRYQAQKRSEAFEKQLEQTLRKARPQDYPPAE